MILTNCIIRYGIGTTHVRYLSCQVKRVELPTMQQTKQFLRPLPPKSSVPPLPTVSLTQSTLPSSTLLDTHNRQHTYLRVSLTEKCNLRCTYCMPEDGVSLTEHTHLLTTTEINQLIKLFVSGGINKLRFTGGEPLVRSDINDIIRYCNTLMHSNIRTSDIYNPMDTPDNIGLHSIGITTNGILLSRKLSGLISSGLTHINISLDTLDKNKYIQISRRDGFDRVLKSLYNCINQLTPHTTLQQIKLNVVVMRNINDNELCEFVRLTQTLPIEIRFIEYMPFDGNRWNNSKFISYNDMLSSIRVQYPDIQQLPLTNNHTSKLWHIPGYSGTIGFITSMSDHFCSTCNRLRITADGNIKVCLFDNKEISLRDAIRNNIDISEIVRIAVQGKQARHAGMFQLAQNKNRPMIKIGG